MNNNEIIIEALIECIESEFNKYINKSVYPVSDIIRNKAEFVRFDSISQNNFIIYIDRQYGKELMNAVEYDKYLPFHNKWLVKIRDEKLNILIR